MDVEVDFFKGDERARTLEVCTFDERYKFQQLVQMYLLYEILS